LEGFHGAFLATGEESVALRLFMELLGRSTNHGTLKEGGQRLKGGFGAFSLFSGMGKGRSTVKDVQGCSRMFKDVQGMFKDTFFQVARPWLLALPFGDASTGIL
jgi:hypothetical protein